MEQNDIDKIAEVFVALLCNLQWEVTEATASPGPGWQPYGAGRYGITLWRRIVRTEGS